MDSYTIVYTILLVIVVFITLMKIGKKMYPTGSDFAFSRWFYRIPISARRIFGGLLVLVGIYCLLVSGHVLFSEEWKIGSLGFMASLFVTVFGAAVIGSTIEPHNSE